MLGFLEASENDFKPEMTGKICMLIQYYGTDKKWHFDNLMQVMIQAGQYVKEEVCRALIIMVTNTPDLQHYVVRECYRVLFA